MNAHEKYARSVCSNALLCVQYHEELNLALSWSWYLVPMRIFPWVVFYSFLEACMYMVLYKVATYKQPKCCSLQKVGTEIAFLLFLRKLRDQSKDHLSHEARFTWLEY